MPYQSFEDLDVWKRSRKIAVGIYELLKDSRDYGLKDQMTRAVVSIASNISEGAERDSKAEFIRFLHIAKGSAAELRTQICIENWELSQTWGTGSLFRFRIFFFLFITSSVPSV